eukprot:6742205-Lingulodinium_polyedra.AAC.1
MECRGAKASGQQGVQGWRIQGGLEPGHGLAICQERNAVRAALLDPSCWGREACRRAGGLLARPCRAGKVWSGRTDGQETG